MSGGKRVVAVSVVVFIAAGTVGTITGGSRGFGSGGATSSYGSGSSSYGSGWMSLPAAGSSVGSPRDTPSGLDGRPGVGTTGGLDSTIGAPRDTELGGGTTGGVNDR
ncbi:MAG: hypothetical protein E6K82_22855 [Candidatus Rokuibacteriota bacterium]|nr:MAG: hypothetical protein E6K82_22855 [Candidatus Rokubacteria bacterium]